MKEYTDEAIENFYLSTMKGFYLNACAQNGGEDERDFYQSQLSEFHDGFKFCLSLTTQGG